MNNNVNLSSSLSAHIAQKSEHRKGSKEKILSQCMAFTSRILEAQLERGILPAFSLVWRCWD